MKQEKWEEQLRHQLADYEEAAPDDLWADIEAQMQKQPASGHRASIVALWGRRVAVAAAFVGLVIGGGYLLYNGEEPMEPQRIEASKVNEPSLKRHEATPGIHDLIPERQESIPRKLFAAVSQSVQPIVADEPLTELEPLESKPKEDPKEETVTSQSQQLPSEEEILRKLDHEIFPHKNHSRPHIGFGLYAQNGFGSEMSANGVLMSPQMAVNYDYSKYMSRTRSDRELIYLANYEERQKHDRPVSFGLVVNYPISSRFSLSTGLVYTRLRSDFTNIMAGYQQTTEQTLQYLGVPLNLQYQLWGYRGLKVYASAGGQADYNLKAHQELNGVDHDIRRDRWQFSVQGAVGVQYDVIPQLGVYVEPGVKRYFDNGSSVRNFFKDKPTNFNLQVGVRLNLGQ